MLDRSILQSTGVRQSQPKSKFHEPNAQLGKGAYLVQHHKDSVLDLLKSVYPEHKFEAWRRKRSAGPQFWQGTRQFVFVGSING